MNTDESVTLFGRVVTVIRRCFTPEPCAVFIYVPANTGSLQTNHFVIGLTIWQNFRGIVGYKRLQSRYCIIEASQGISLNDKNKKPQ